MRQIWGSNNIFPHFDYYCSRTITIDTTNHHFMRKKLKFFRIIVTNFMSIIAAFNVKMIL